jgi:hypothetical protein
MSQIIHLFFVINIFFAMILQATFSSAVLRDANMESGAEGLASMSTCSGSAQNF